MRQAAKARERKDAEKSKNARKVRTEFSLGWLAGWLIILTNGEHTKSKTK